MSKKNILVIGSGGREHALAWKIKQSVQCGGLYIAPGNPGTAVLGENVSIGVNDFNALYEFVTDKKVDIVVVGPEDPLVNGIYDFFQEKKYLGKIIGPSQEGAQLEGSKAFSKKFMARHKVPTAAYAEFDVSNYQDGLEYLKKHTLPIVLKADGLAAGKGVVIATTVEEALKTFEDMIQHKQFGEASSKVVIEQFLAGIEVSVFVLTDGKEYKIIGHAKDYKRIGEGDTGLNTGGMGCVTPIPFMDKAFMEKVENQIIKPTVDGLAEEHIDYKGFIFFGLINVEGEPFVIEYNSRMGDPETEVVTPRLKTDIVNLFDAVYDGGLDKIDIQYNDGAFATVVAVSGGYPGDYEKGKKISINGDLGDSILFHAGTKSNTEGDILTNGGRVLTVTSAGASIAEAAAKSINNLEKITFDGMNFRRDIGYEFQ
ncbi:MAG: phosphoribosylamine--glycine ligase [Pseudopedobacter saltans]|uniref:Phosphoribosylamine--glycine ligase n=1 Tax=Pseudopedobacter saltans TaxID=151895 RepID=A0A2W5H6L7_9SPHI|nr:MAG: phosphoribosylamine--glycine ligase [Pseudopedobacter saltans]